VGGLGVYRQLLGNRPLTRLLAGEFISGIGDWLYIVAIFVVIYRQSGDAALVGAFGGIRLLPYVFLSVPAGIIADRFDRRMVLLVSDLFRGALMVVMAVLVQSNGSTLLIAALAILAACGSTFFYPAMGAYVPALARDESQIGPANSAVATIQNISFILGPAVGGLVLALGSVTLAFVINALSFLVIAAVLWTLPPSFAKREAAPEAEPEAEATAEPGTAAAAQAGTTSGAATAIPGAAPSAPRAFMGVPLMPASGLLVVQLIGGFLGGGYQVITVILAIDVLGAGEQGNGYLNAAIGIGGLLGGFLAGALVLRRHLGLPLAIGAVIMGIGTIALGASTSLPLALATIAIGSAGALIIDIVSTTIFQQLVPDALRGRAFGILMMLGTLTGAVGAFVLPTLLAQVGVFPSLAVAGTAGIVITIIGTLMIGNAAERPLSPYETTIERIITLPLFTGVPRARLQSAMRKVAERPVAAGEAVVRQGEPADTFYIITKGEFAVSRAETPGSEPTLLRTLGPDEVFGELGLLNQAPRSATVAAETDGVVLAMKAEDFLALVGAEGSLRGRLLGLYAGAGTVTR
jgi:MFS family permease